MAILLLIFGYEALKKSSGRSDLISYSQFLDAVAGNQVKSVTIGDGEIKGEYSTASGGKFRTFAPKDDKLVETLRANKVEIRAEPANNTPWWLVMVNFLPYLLIFLFIFFLMRQAQAGGSQAFSFGRSKAKLYGENKPKVTFEDVAGVEEAKEELQEIVEFLKYPKRFQKLGARIPKGVLLLGPPGAGKTLLGRAIAGEAGVPFFYISGSDFVEMFVGVGASRVRDLFEQAKRSSPCIIFVDEIDAVGRMRGAGLGGGHDEREQTLNQLLVEMDGFEINSGVILIAATNRPDVLDPALLRPGRFDRQVVVDRADVAGRKAILQIHSRGKALGPDVELEVLARRTPGFSGADLENLLNEAALLAARLGKEQIEMSECEEAIDRVVVGPERKSRIITDKEKRITAYHEAGHALVAKLVPNPQEDRHLLSRGELLSRITGLLGGRIAEEVAFQEITTGAENDLKHATEIAHKMVCEYGMSDKLGPVTFGKKREQIFLGRDIVEDRNYSEDIANRIDAEVRAILDGCYAQARELLLANRQKLDRVVEVLLEREVLDGQELDKILQEFDEERVQEASPSAQDPKSSSSNEKTDKQWERFGTESLFGNPFGEGQPQPEGSS
ncbi:MAG: ATP-dependent metallopeptidase FtsH/Yme1/Tma family protein [Armatimonadetes bacterium]|nr:ATP-dependent metallopeptidase FtsH/Yme1/Tma family protein [Armatimonadota bacterium]